MTFDKDDDVPLFSKKTFRLYAARLAAKATVQPETDTGMSDDDDDVPVFDGTQGDCKGCHRHVGRRRCSRYSMELK